MVEVLVAVPWLVHVVALPLAFHLPLTGWARTAELLGRGAVFIATAAIIIPTLGIFDFFAVGASIGLLTQGN